jgi:hypothetical protein
MSAGENFRRWVPRKIVSGGQSGADRAALDAARLLGLQHGGWVPRGRWAEDGNVPQWYCVRETPSSRLSQRTLWNVRDSDATLIVTHGRLEGGSKLTRTFAHRLKKPVLVIDLTRQSFLNAARLLRIFLQEYHPLTLNVAGPRASKMPHIYQETLDLLLSAFQ